MLRQVLSLLLFCNVALTSAQNVGINVDGAAPHASALLDIDATALPVNNKRGLLIPRTTSAERVAIVAPATGLLVYDTTLNSFWYYNGTAWVPLFTATTGWSITGNAGTVAGTNFIGTTDNIAFEVRMFNERAGFVSSGTSTSWGHRALWLNTGTSNSAFGKSALMANTTGSQNTAVGSYALTNNVNGSRNTAIGFQALRFNLSSTNNTAVGYNALQVTTAGDNTAVGSETLLLNVLGTDNTAVGREALRVNVAGSQNTAIGSNALYTNTGSDNTAAGYTALRANTTAYGGTAMGSLAMTANTTGILNAAFGHRALATNTSGSDNTATGAYALYGNTNGVNNSAFGFQALDNNTTGDYNTAMGYQAGFGSATQSYNTTYGFQAGISGMSTGTLIGASIVQNANTYTNISGLGYGTTLDGSNRVRLGNTAITSIGGYAGWTTLPSDARFKKNVREDVGGLDFILRLRPVTYNVDVQKLVDYLGEDMTLDTSENRVPREQAPEIIAARKEKEALRFTGFIAQEVDSAAKAIGYDFSGVDKNENDDRMLGLRYAEFVVPLVKALQEQQVMIEEQRVMIEELRKHLGLDKAR